jgi:hypothetical protein
VIGARALVAAAALSATAATARGDYFVRGAIKIDVRGADGQPRAATVRVHAAAGEAAVTRAGDVYVADGLVDGDYTVEVDGAAAARVAVRGRLGRGVVFVLGGKRAQTLALGPGDVACDAADGVVVEAVAFARDGALGAGRLEVRGGHGQPVCSAIVAGGAATLRLLPGDYDVTARLVGPGGVARAHYRLPRDHTPPLALRAR